MSATRPSNAFLNLSFPIIKCFFRGGIHPFTATGAAHRTRLKEADCTCGRQEAVWGSRDLSNREDENPSKLELRGLNRWCLNDEQQ